MNNFEKKNFENYTEHRETAEGILAGLDEIADPSEELAEAQVHALLAIAAAVMDASCELAKGRPHCTHCCPS